MFILEKIFKIITAHKFLHLFLKARVKFKERCLYKKWILANEPTNEELYLQKKVEFGYEPKISILCPLYNTPEIFFVELLDSVKEQTYSNFELILADASSNSKLEKKIASLNDSRFRYLNLGENFGIAENTNKAFEYSDGEYLAFLDHDDLLAPFALFEVVKFINENKKIELIYSDEDVFINSLLNRKNPFLNQIFRPIICYV